MTEIKRKKLRRFNKSVALIEFEKHEDKLKTLRVDFRNLGINISKNICKIDDLDYKRTLVINNIPYGSEIEEIVEFLNDTLFFDESTSKYPKYILFQNDFLILSRDILQCARLLQKCTRF